MWLLGFVAALSVGAFLLPPFGPVVSVIAVAVTAVAVSAGLAAWATTVEVGDGELRAGRAHVSVRLLGEPIALDAERAALLRGRDIDPAAYHLIRSWVRCAVLVDLSDPQDPTPYWYVATHQPQRLAEAIQAARGDR